MHQFVRFIIVALSFCKGPFPRIQIQCSQATQTCKCDSPTLLKFCPGINFFTTVCSYRCEFCWVTCTHAHLFILIHVVVYCCSMIREIIQILNRRNQYSLYNLGDISFCFFEQNNNIYNHIYSKTSLYYRPTKCGMTMNQ